MSYYEFRFSSPEDAPLLAALHEAAFVHPQDVWLESALSQTMASAGCFTLTVWEHHLAVAFILFRVGGEQADILTLATLPEHQRQGLATRMIGHACNVAREQGALDVFLEVAEDNLPAQQLYEHCGFSQISVRKQYYQRQGKRIAAWVMKHPLRVVV